MSQVTPGHLLANRAVLAVCTVLGRAGAIAETIKNDYGEDLVVQTNLEGFADSFSILIQVKGTILKRNSRNLHSFRIDRSHLYRWISHMQSVLVCVYDDLSGKIFVFFPRQRWSLWELSAPEAKSSLTVKFSDKDIFDETTARKLIWECRIENFGHLTAWLAHGMDNQYPQRTRKRAWGDILVLTLNFLRMVKIIEDRSVNDEFRKMFGNACTNMSREPSGGLDTRHAIVLSILGRVSQVAEGCGLPGNLLDNCSAVTAQFFAQWHADEWAWNEKRFIVGA